MSAATEYHVVELTDESDDLVGYGVCVITNGEDKRQTFRMLPEVHGVRSQARTAALDARDAGVVA